MKLCTFVVAAVMIFSTPLAVKADHPALALNGTVGGLDFLTDHEKDVIRELNLARTDPKGYARLVNEFKRFYIDGAISIDNRVPVETFEGIEAVDEAVGFLNRVSPVSPLKVSRGLSHAARDHVKDQGNTGATGHSGSDDSTPRERMNRYGSIRIKSGENISYGFFEARHIVIMFIIDDGVKSRSHRKNVYDPAFRVVGVHSSGHRDYEWMCVLDFAAGYQEK